MQRPDLGVWTVTSTSMALHNRITQGKKMILDFEVIMIYHSI